MNYKSIKLASEAPFPLEIIKHDNSIKAVVIGDIRIEGDYGIKVLLAQPHEEVSRFRVEATIDGFGTKTLYFESEWESREDVAKLEAAGAVISSGTLKVFIDSKGEIVSTEVSQVGNTGSVIPF